MPTTERMQFPYPSFRKDPWYDEIEATFAAIDAASYASREDRGALLVDGGVISWTVSSSTLAWAGNLGITSAAAGLLCVMAAGSVTISEGQFLYVNLTRYPQSNVTVTPNVAAVVPSTDSAFVLAIRRNDRIVWRNSAVLADGDSRALFEDPPGGESLAQTMAIGNTTGGSDLKVSAGDSVLIEQAVTPTGLAGWGAIFVSDGTGGLISGEPYYMDGTGTPRRILGGGVLTRTLATNESVDGVTSLLQIGQFAFDPTPYGSGINFQFEVVISVNIGTLTGTASLYNLTDSETVTATTLSTSNTTPTKRNSGNLTVGGAAGNLKSTEKIYEVRIQNDGSLVTDLTFLGSAVMIAM